MGVSNLNGRDCEAAHEVTYLDALSDVLYLRQMSEELHLARCKRILRATHGNGCPRP
jgi:hypothetical protein